MSVDLFYETGSPGDGREDALAVEMEAATLFALGELRGAQVACALVVSDTFDASGARARITEEALLAAAERMGAVALAALCA